MSKDYDKRLEELNQYIRNNRVEEKSLNLHSHILNILRMVRELTKEEK